MSLNTSSRLLSSIALAALLSSAAVAYADPGKPNFMPAVWGDGVVWGTKATTTLPAPNGYNQQSFDALYVIINNPDAPQLPVAEAAPGNPSYNGGRWITHTVMWTAAGLAAHNPVPVLTSYADIMYHAGFGHLAIASGSFVGGPPDYFECPLLPVKGY